MDGGDTISGVGASDAITLIAPLLTGSHISPRIQPNSTLTLTGLATCHDSIHPAALDWPASWPRRKAA
jgi:hypothetical protein